MTFPVSMRWANNSFEYIRPVHSLIVLLDDEPLELDFLDIHSGRISRGHRFLGEETSITSADSYEVTCAANLSLPLLRSAKK